MAYFDWNDRYSVNVAELDRQHRRLMEMISEFYTLLERDGVSDAVHSLLDGLQDYAHKHFSEEETFLESKGYALLDEHRLEHERFNDKLRDLRERFERGRLTTTFELSAFLKNWLSGHILQADKKYARTLTAAE